jgi:hypothetical protein
MFVSFGPVLRWIPAELGLKEPSFGEDDGRIEFRSIAPEREARAFHKMPTHLLINRQRLEIR